LTFCSSVHRKRKKENSDQEGIVVVVHDTTIVGPIFSTSLALARFAAAERAHAILRDTESKKCLQRLCTCALAIQVGDQFQSTIVPSDLEEEEREVVEMLCSTGLETYMVSQPGIVCGSALLTEVGDLMTC
jgi:hypothetical protein